MNMLVYAAASAVVAASNCAAVVPNSPPDTAFAWVGPVGGASGTAIARRTVIIAKHVGGSTYESQGVIYTATHRIHHPTMDIALLIFDRDLPGWHRLGAEAPIGAASTMVGFGCTGVLNSQGTGYDIWWWSGGTRIAGANTIGEKWNTVYGPSLISWLNVNGDAAAVNGDSGGACFVGDRLVGVISFAFSTNHNLPVYGFASLNGGVPYIGSGAIDLTEPTVRAWVRANMVPSPNDCPADFDQDGFVSGLDFDLYIAAFEAGDLDADFDQDGFLTGIDFDSYVGAFEDGC